MQSKVTQLLVVCLLAAALLDAWLWSRNDDSARAAVDSQNDLKACNAYVKTLGANLAPATIEGANEMQLTRVHSVAAAAGVGDNLSSTDVLDSHPIRDTGYNETPVLITLNNVNLKQVVTFLHDLCTQDHQMRPQIIELRPPTPTPGAAPATANEKSDLWTADIKLEYLSYAPHERKKL